jgi:catechol 2,3-dioxygenase-like lactoylglutathione lyase family enzyme
MKRFHVHLSVSDLGQSIGFYSGLLGFAPTVRKDDYAKWMLDEPRVNFAISQRGAPPGLNHLGFQADDEQELAGIRTQFEQADASSTVAEPDTACCYARSNKHWVLDPEGIPWEAFHTFDTIPVYDGAQLEGEASECCAPQPDSMASMRAQAGCCAPGATVAVGANACCR